MKLPDGYEAHIVPRSSTFKRWGILQTNHFGGKKITPHKYDTCETSGNIGETLQILAG